MEAHTEGSAGNAVDEPRQAGDTAAADPSTITIESFQDANQSILLDTNETILSDFSVTVHDDEISSTEAKEANTAASRPPAKQSGIRRRRQKRLHGIRNAVVEAAVKPQGLTIPENQYETELVRRAIRKASDKPEKEAVLEDQDGMDMYGDISLGMKLTVVGGKVIVQMLNSLSDGRASPAQLTGKIRRGDVLLAIQGKTLVNLPLEQLMSGLSPLSTPNPVTGSYQRRLKLRFSIGDGLKLLEKSESMAKSKNEPAAKVSQDPATDVFSLFPMVDQLSGMPLFEEQILDAAKWKQQETQSETSIESSEAEQAEENEVFVQPDEVISRKLAAESNTSRETFTSEFFSWNGQLSILLRRPLELDGQLSMDGETPVSQYTLTELIELGRRALLGARTLSLRVEQVDSGKDLRSFRSWNTTLSQYSRASTRRRYVFDAASVPVNFGRVEEEEDDDDSKDGGKVSEASEEEEELDGDELLVKLAAHDDIWRKQVVEFFGQVRDELDKPSNGDSADKIEKSETIDSALSKELGSFLFGDNMTKILSNNKKPQSLPPEDATAVLFDLTTKVTASVPDEITAVGSYISYRSSLVPFTGMKRPAAGSDLMLATRFLLDEALPAWLKSFRPLPWEHRRVLWPLERASTGGSTAASTLSDDSLTVDTTTTNQPTNATRARKRKNLRELIEEQELNPETRNETCFLTTFFFTQVLLPKCRQEKQVESTFSIAVEESKAFIKEYGSYLKLHTCLAYAAVLKAESILDELLDLAKHDPRHREVIKQTSKSNALIFYEPTMISAAMQRLRGLRRESNFDNQRAITDFCASAFPDVRPWQVQRECGNLNEDGKLVPFSEALGQLYYNYLSMLLHPMDGHDAARRNGQLVQEWCAMSVSGEVDEKEKKRRLRNFFFVASRTSSDHLAYNRDVAFLARLGMQIAENNLVLDLVNEIFDSPQLAQKENIVDSALEFLRKIADNLVKEKLKDDESKKLLKRLVRLYRKGILSSCAKTKTSTPSELLRIIDHAKSLDDSSIGKSGRVVSKLLSFLADEAMPDDILEALSRWEALPEAHSDILPILQKTMRRGSYVSVGSELSVSLLRLQRARMNLTPFAPNDRTIAESDLVPGETIWKSMSKGLVVLSK